MFYFTGLLFVVFMLAGCGGGGGGQAIPEAPPSPQPPPEIPSPPSVSAILEDLIDVSTSVLHVFSVDGDNAGINIREVSTKPTPATLDLSHLTFNRAPMQRLEERQGVQFGYGRWQPDGEDGGGLYDYAGWLDHSFFVLKLDHRVGQNPLNPFEFVGALMYSLGDVTGTNPVSGSATWRGAAVGVDISQTETMGNIILGDATLTVDDFMNPAVDVALTNLRDLDANAPRRNMTWNNIPLGNGSFGVFEQDSLTGRFYGPNHEEVGGIFRRANDVTGAFGAARQ